MEQNIPEGAPKVDLPIRTQKTPSTIDFSQLKSERSLQDTVVIQKTYMPKTGRVQVFGGATLSMNDVFYRTYGGELRAGYYFNETWGLELNTFFLSSSDTQEKTDLAGKQNLDVRSLSTPKSLYALNVYYSSIYGKMALEDRKIIPYEFYKHWEWGRSRPIRRQLRQRFTLVSAICFPSRRIGDPRGSELVLLHQ